MLTCTGHHQAVMSLCQVRQKERVPSTAGPVLALGAQVSTYSTVLHMAHTVPLAVSYHLL